MGSSVLALEAVNLEIFSGSFVAIVGRSGSGKTTLLNLLGCLDQPTSGHIFLKGIDTRELNDRTASSLRNRLIGFLFQSFNLIPQMSVFENVETAMLYGDVPESDWRARTEDILVQLDMWERRSHLPDELSGGEAQRVALARALVTQPELLLADEPTGNLDSKTGDFVLRIMEELVAEGTTLILVTHDPEIACRSQRIIELSDGKVIRDDQK